MADVSLRIESKPVQLKLGTSRPVQLNIAAGRGGSGPQGPAGQVEDYVYVQSEPSALWNVAHNLGRKPAVTVYGVGGLVVEAKVHYLSDDVCQVEFNQPFAGSARCV